MDDENIDWQEACEGVPRRDILENLDLDNADDLDRAVEILVGQLEGEMFFTWEAVICEEQGIDLTEDQEQRIDDLLHFGDDDEEDILYIDEVPRHCEPWYATVRRVVPHLLLERYETAAGHDEVMRLGWPRLAEAIEEYGPPLSLPEGVTAPIDVVPEEVRHCLWLQRCYSFLDNIGQEGWSLQDEELQYSVDDLIENLREHKDSVAFFELTLDKMFNVLVLPDKEEQILVRLMSDKLGLGSRGAPIAEALGA